MHLALFYFFQKCRLTGQDTDAVRQYLVAYFMFWEGIFISTLWPRFWNSRQFHKQPQLCAKRRIELLRIKVPYGIYIYIYIWRERVCVRACIYTYILCMFGGRNLGQYLYHYCVLQCFHAMRFVPVQLLLLKSMN